jgi:hypothetical protein
MGLRRGSISTPIIVDGLVFNMDAANRTSTIPNTNTLKTFNTINPSISGSIITDGTWEDGSPSTFNFDGTDGYIRTNGISLSGNATISFWTQLASSQATYVGLLTAYNYWTVGENNSFSLQWFGSNQFRIVSSNGQSPWSAQAYTPNNPSFSADTWYNISVVLDTSSQTIQPYWNGTDQGWSALATSGRTFAGVDEGIAVGTYLLNGSANSSYTMDGNISCVHIYNRALTPPEILHNYNALKGRFGL